MGNIVTLSFDDGREDNYRNAWPIMKEYNLTGTFFVTTGYIDQEWTTNKWISSNGAMTIEQLQELYASGCEIAAHGNRHVSEIEDISICIQKLKKWGVIGKTYGFSAPCSKENAELKNYLKKTGVCYIRMGRGSKCNSLLYRVMHKIFMLTKWQLIYNIYYHECANSINNFQKDNILAMPVLRQDRVENIIKYIDTCNDKWVVLMFHSILDDNEDRYGADDYCWSKRKFRKLCQYLNSSSVKTQNLLDIVSIYK